MTPPAHVAVLRNLKCGHVAGIAHTELRGEADAEVERLRALLVEHGVSDV